MSEHSQIVVPPSFVALFLPPGRSKPTAAREHIAARYELCEDLATMLTETAQTMLWQLSITEADVLERMRRGLVELPGEQRVVDDAEAAWVLRRLAELLGWMPLDSEPG